jgi:Anti-sigma-K factor rskA
VKLLRPDLHLLTGCYAVDALTGPELADFERHLERCSSCATEVRGLRAAAARLAMAAAVQPPPAMEERVLSAATRVRQLPPTVSGKPRSHYTRQIVASVSVAAAVSLGAWHVVTQHQLDDAQARNRAIAAVLGSPGARIESIPTIAGGSLTAVIAAGQRQAVVTAAGMPSPPPGKVYQVWLINASGASSAGLLPAAEAGRPASLLADGISPGDEIGVTVEPAGGTTHPTTTPLALITGA